MQKNLKLFFVQYSQKQLYPLNPCFFSKLQQYPPGTPSIKDTAWVFVYPALNLGASSSVIPVKSVPFGTRRRIIRFPFSLLPRSYAL